MEADDLPTSPRKKLKAHHDSRLNMVEDPAPNMLSSTRQNPSPVNATGSEDRLDKEVQCGITEYVSPHLLGFEGILKKRYTDFLVNEILPNGKVIHLDSLKKPSDKQRLSQAASKTRQQQSGSSDLLLSECKQPLPPKENGPPRFESTNLNRVEKGSRKKETVYMQHGAETLSLVNEQNSKGLDDLKQSVPVKDNGQITENEAAQPGKVNSGDIEDKVSIESQEPEDDVLEQAETPNKGEPDASLVSDHIRSSNTSTTAGWQAYAQSKTDVSAFALSEDDKDLLISFFDPETVDDILALFNRILASPLRKARDFGTIKTKPIERDVRTEIHQAIRRIFSSRLVTTTDDCGAMVIAAASPSSDRGTKNNAWYNDRNSKPQQPKGKLGWAQLGGDYLHFTIYKENKDTMEAVAHLARVLKLRPQLFQFAGTKDRRGVTVQRASVYRVQASRLHDAGKTLRQSKIGDFEYHPQGLQLGDLMGNEFVLTLRDCQFHLSGDLDLKTKIQQAPSILDTVVENFSSHGFINYFGLQRFGSFSTGTHAIGKSMLQGDFRSACEGILSFQPSALAAAQQESEQQDASISRDDMARASALHTFATTSHSKQALEQLPRKFSAEACLIRHLSRTENRNDYLGALQTISRNLRLMYVHAYQSLVWNIAASARWKTHGSKVLPGDLVLVNKHPDPSIKQNTDTSTVDQDGEPIIAAEPSDRAYTSDEIFTRARPLTEPELASPECTISIFDIVLPLPGYDILYPANDSANIYKEFMASEEGGGLDPYDMRRKWKDVSLSGSYRKLLAKPLGEVEWQVRAYGAKGDDEQFVETDLERLEKVNEVGGMGRRKAEPAKAGESPSLGVDAGQEGLTPVEADTEPKNPGTADTSTDSPTTIPNHESNSLNHKPTTTAGDTTSSSAHPSELKNGKLAVILKMQLGSSTYATMALRELMKEGGVKTWKGDYGGGR
ncbi:MAG: hypothetical protein Q9225_002574 [Loekoesia sp. 1 TL-2023]